MRVIQKTCPTGAAALALALAMPPAWGAPRAAQLDPAAVVSRVYALTQELRMERRLSGLTPESRLEDAARQFAEYMARTGRYGHEADGSTPAARASRHGYEHCIVSENLAYQQDSRGLGAESLAQRYVAGWKRSPAHRRNMLDPDVIDTAVAVARNPRDGRYYAVQMFGRPRSAMIEFRLTNNGPEAVRYHIDGDAFRLAPRATGAHQRCRPGAILLHGPGRDAPLTVRPANGDRYVIGRAADGSWMLTRER